MFRSAQLKTPGGPLKEWAVTGLTHAALGCLLASPAVLYQPPDTAAEVQLHRAESSTDISDHTPVQEFTLCTQYLKKGGEPSPADQFNCPALAPRSRGHELLTQLREGLETKGHHAVKWSGQKWNEGKIISVLLRVVTGLLREIKDLEARLRTAGMESLEQAARGSKRLPFQDGAGEEGENKRGEKVPSGDRPTVPSPSAPSPEVEPRDGTPPGVTRRESPASYEGETLYLALPVNTEPSLLTVPHPIALVEQLYPAFLHDAQRTTQTTTTHSTRTRPELQDLCCESRVKPGETLAMWLGRLVVEFGSDILDSEEASVLTRQAAWSGGHATDLDVVTDNDHWPIPLPALVVGQVTHKSHVWHEG